MSAVDNNEIPEIDEKKMLMQRAKLLGIVFSNNITVDKLREKINEKLGVVTETVTEPVEDKSEDTETQKESSEENQEEEIEQTLEQPGLGDLTFLGSEITETPQTVIVDHSAVLAELEKLRSQNAELLAKVNAAPQVNALEASAQVAASKVSTPAAIKSVKSGKTQSLRQMLYNEQMRLVRIRLTCMDPKKSTLQGEIITVANQHLGTVSKFIPFGEASEEGYHVPYCIYKVLDKRRFLNIRTIKDKRTGVEQPEAKYLKEFAIEVLPPLSEEELKQLGTAQMAAGSVD